MIPPFTYKALPAKVLFGPGRVAEVHAAVRDLNCSRALVLSTPEQRPAADGIAARLGDLAVGVFAGAVMHTPVEVTEQALRVFRHLGADCVVSIGGGSTTGLGKAIALRNDAPQLVIPTTYAGSEMTPIIGETSGGRKTTQRTPKVLPEVVIYDVELTLSLPPRVSATSGMNAMAHAVEALYAKDGNPVVSLMAEAGLAALAMSLPRIMQNPTDLEARTEAQYGAWLCGMCLGATTMALHHKLCHVLGGAFDLPHAETHAIVLPHAVAYNAPAAPEAMRSVAGALHVSDAADGLYSLAQSLAIPLALQDIGMPASGIDRVVELVVKDPYWNPRAIESEEIRRLILRAFFGEPPLSTSAQIEAKKDHAGRR